MSIDSGVLDELLDEVESFAYFIQVWGDVLWRAARRAGATLIDEPIFDSARPSARLKCEEFRRERLMRLTPDELELVKDLASYRYPFDAAEVHRDARALGRDDLVSDLIDSGLLVERSGNSLQFMIPDFYDFLTRA